MIMVIGNCGNSKNRIIGGQHIRTRSVIELLNQNYLETVLVVDLSKSIFLSIIKILFGLIFCRKIILMPGRNFLTLIAKAPWLFKWKSVYLVSIGGWLSEACEDIRIKTFVQRLDGVLVQTLGLKNKMQVIGIDTILFPNFKFYSEMRQKKLDTQTLNVVYCSRISEKKGILHAVEAFKILSLDFHLHVYGPLQGIDLNNLIKDSKNISYYGELSPQDVPAVLAQYDIFLFPTYFEGEGFPGVILDAFTAGIPVIATDWKYNSEYVTKDVGLLIHPQSSQAIVDAIRNLSEDRQKMRSMSIQAKKKSNDYHPDNIFPILRECLDD